jgi:hypothetical protein
MENQSTSPRWELQHARAPSSSRIAPNSPTSWRYCTANRLYEPPTDQVIVHRILEAAYRSADEKCEIKL